MSKNKVACFPQISNYNIPVNMFVRNVLDMKTMECPKTTKRTIEKGSINSPDYVCTPFKHTLGNYIDALNNGANVLITPAIGCRLGYYDEVQKTILKDLGYEFEMLNLFEYGTNLPGIYKLCKTFNKNLNVKKFVENLYFVSKVVIHMDYFENYLRLNMAFELEKGKMQKLYDEYLKQLRKTTKVKALNALYEKYKKLINDVEINKPENPIKIGLVGDLYTLLEKESNCYIEKCLIERGVEIHKPMTLTHIFKELPNEKLLLKQSGKYLKYGIGGNATDSVAKAKIMAEEKVNGIIHMKASACTPEITAMSALQNISRDYNIPILYFTFDTETSETGIITRIEAFHDMLIMKEGK